MSVWEITMAYEGVKNIAIFTILKQIKKKSLNICTSYQPHDKVLTMWAEGYGSKKYSMGPPNRNEIRKETKPKNIKATAKRLFRIWNRKSIKLRRHLCVFW